MVVQTIKNPDTHVESFGQVLAGPAAGDHFLSAVVTVTNVSGTVKNAPIGLFFEVSDTIGHTYTPTHFHGDFAPLGGPPSGGLDSGASMSGTVTVEVPDRTEHLTLYFSPDWPLTLGRLSFAVPSS